MMSGIRTGPADVLRAVLAPTRPGVDFCRACTWKAFQTTHTHLCLVYNAMRVLRRGADDYQVVA